MSHGNITQPGENQEETTGQNPGWKAIITHRFLYGDYTVLLKGRSTNFLFDGFTTQEDAEFQAKLFGAKEITYKQG